MENFVIITAYFSLYIELKKHKRRKDDILL